MCDLVPQRGGEQQPPVLGVHRHLPLPLGDPHHLQLDRLSLHPVVGSEEEMRCRMLAMFDSVGDLDVQLGAPSG